MTEASWYIDALDGFGGLAFASHRPTDLLLDSGGLAGPAWVLSAPDFTPEPVASRAIAMAATRRGLQLGLSLTGGTEVRERWGRRDCSAAR
jgi:hypothetical protein